MVQIAVVRCTPSKNLLSKDKEEHERFMNIEQKIICAIHTNIEKKYGIRNAPEVKGTILIKRESSRVRNLISDNILIEDFIFDDVLKVSHEIL